MKTNAIVRIVLFSIAILVLAGILLAGLAFGWYMFDGNAFVSTSGHSVSIDENSESYFADPSVIQDIEIEWAAGSITIQPSDRDQITITETAVSDSRYQMVVKEAGSKLSIEYCEESISFIGINNADYEPKDLVIFIPSGWNCDTLEIDAAAAEVDISDLSIREVEFDGASAICTFTNCQVETLDVDTASGDVEFEGILDELDFDAMSACFTAVLSNTPRRMDLDSMSGDLDITLPEDCGFTLNLDAMSSDFSSDFATTMQNGSHICGNGSCRINVSAMSGDVTIRKAK